MKESISGEALDYCTMKDLPDAREGVVLACSGRDPGAGYLFLRGSGRPEEISLRRGQGYLCQCDIRFNIEVNTHGFTDMYSRNCERDCQFEAPLSLLKSSHLAPEWRPTLDIGILVR